MLHSLQSGCTIGQVLPQAALRNDPKLQYEHFRITKVDNDWQIESLSHAEPTWVYLRKPELLKVNDRFRLGSIQLEVVQTHDWIKAKTSKLHSLARYSLVQIENTGDIKAVFMLPDQTICKIGRALSDINITDTTLSVTHAALSIQGDTLQISDLGSESGVWRRLRGSETLPRRTLMCAGNTLFLLP